MVITKKWSRDLVCTSPIDHRNKKGHRLSKNRHRLLSLNDRCHKGVMCGTACIRDNLHCYIIILNFHYTCTCTVIETQLKRYVSRHFKPERYDYGRLTQINKKVKGGGGGGESRTSGQLQKCDISFVRNIGYNFYF